MTSKRLFSDVFNGGYETGRSWTRRGLANSKFDAERARAADTRVYALVAYGVKHATSIGVGAVVGAGAVAATGVERTFEGLAGLVQNHPRMTVGAIGIGAAALLMPQCSSSERDMIAYTAPSGVEAPTSSAPVLSYTTKEGEVRRGNVVYGLIAGEGIDVRNSDGSFRKLGDILTPDGSNAREVFTSLNPAIQSPNKIYPGQVLRFRDYNQDGQIKIVGVNGDGKTRYVSVKDKR